MTQDGRKGVLFSTIDNIVRNCPSSIHFLFSSLMPYGKLRGIMNKNKQTNKQQNKPLSV